MWDPYGSIKHLPVGIVNSDIPIVKGHKTYSLGKKLTHQLVNNHDADFKQVNKSVAKNHLKMANFIWQLPYPRISPRKHCDLDPRAKRPFTLIIIPMLVLVLLR